MKKITLITLSVFISLFFVACNNNDDLQYEESINLNKIGMCYVVHELYDTIFTEKGDTTFSLKVGECLYDSEPNKFYIVANSAEEAAIFYNTNCTNEHWMMKYKQNGDSMKLDFDVCDRVTNFGEFGSTTLTIGDKTSFYATITLNLATIGQEHTLVFVPKSFMPNNSDSPSFCTPYFLGQIWKDTNGIQWLCVRESQPGLKGYFIRFGVDKLSRKTQNTKRNTLKYYERIDNRVDYFFADRDACKAFFSLLEWDEGQSVYKAMQDPTNGISMDDTKKVLDKFYNNIGKDDVVRFQVGKTWWNDDIFWGLSINVGHNYWLYKDTHVYHSDADTGSYAPIRIKTFYTEAFDNWRLVFPQSDFI